MVELQIVMIDFKIINDFKIIKDYQLFVWQD